MNGLGSVRKFEYRPCRIETGFNVDFVTDAETLYGCCKDVSDAGIRATLDRPAEVGCSGLLILRHPTGVLEIQAQVAYVDHCQVGLVFTFRTPWEHELTNEYIASIVNPLAASLVVRFP
jgi:hypothetical protein